MPTGQTATKKTASTKKAPKEVIEGISSAESLADQTLTPTPITEWGKKKTDSGIILELPSGNVCKIHRTMDMMTMLQAGKIPNPLARTINEMIDSGNPNLGEMLAQQESPEVMRQLFDLVNRTTEKIWIEPPVSCPESRKKGEDWDDYAIRVDDWVPEEGTLSVFAIDMEDKMYAFAVAQGGPADLDRFREEQESVMGSVQASKPVVKPTKRTGGSRSKK